MSSPVDQSISNSPITGGEVLPVEAKKASVSRRRSSMNFAAIKTMLRTRSMVRSMDQGKGEKQHLEETAIHSRHFFNEKWSGPLLLGPFPIAIASIFFISFGSYAQNATRTICPIALNAFISAVISLCYFFLLVYGWIFLGSPLKYKRYTLLSPFTTLHSIIPIYCLLALLSLGVFAFGTSLLSSGSLFCKASTPLLYFYALYVTGIFWIGTAIVVINLIRIRFNINVLQSILRYDDINEDDVLVNIFMQKFQLFIEKDKSTEIIPVASFGALCEALEIEATEAELAQWVVLMDPEDSKYISQDVLYKWYKSKLQ